MRGLASWQGSNVAWHKELEQWHWWSWQAALCEGIWCARRAQCRQPDDAQCARHDAMGGGVVHTKALASTGCCPCPGMYAVWPSVLHD